MTDYGDGPDVVAEGVWRISTPMTGASGSRKLRTNGYLVVDDAHAVAIDTGWSFDTSPHRLDELLAAAGTPVLDAVILTHGHSDHAGFAGYLQERSGAAVLMLDGEQSTYRSLSGWMGLPDLPTLENWFLAHGFPPAEAQAVAATQTPRPTITHALTSFVPPGTAVPVGSRSLELLATPGHTKGHLCVVDRDAGVLFSGDSLIPRGFGNPHALVRPDSIEDPLTAYLAGIERMRDVGARVCMPGHGPVVDDIGALVDEHVAFVESKMLVALAAVDDTPATAYEVASRMSWHSGLRTFADLEPLATMIAFGDALARLRALAARGIIRASASEPVTYWVG